MISLLLGVSLAAAHLLALEVLVQEVKGGLVGLGAAHDGEHSLASVIVRSLGNRDSSAGSLADLADLASTTANDASNHVGRNADVLCLDLLSVLVVCWDATAGGLAIRAAVEGSWCLLAEISTVASAHHAWAAVFTALVANAALSTTGLGADNWVVEDSAGSALPIIDQALADLPDRLLDTLWGSLDLDDALGGLRKHLLLGNHPDARDVLDVLNLKTLAANDRAHLVVRDKKLDG